MKEKIERMHINAHLIYKDTGIDKLQKNSKLVAAF